jgi:hypothetical protein
MQRALLKMRSISLKIRTILFFTLCFVTKISLAQSEQLVTISGRITEQLTGEALIGATIIDSLSNKGTTTNTYGFYSLKLPKSHKVTLSISFVGYVPQVKSINLTSDTTLYFGLIFSSLREIVIQSTPVNIANGDHLKISPQSIKDLPHFGSEVDVLSSLQLLPGVESGLEGSSNYNVRGGGGDQNRIYMDNITIYNTGHLGNIVSIFDPFTINSIDFYKNGFPSKYSGALSSITDIYLREGDKKSYHGAFSIGVLSSKFALEGPIIKDRSSFLISYRRSLYDFLLSTLGQNTEFANYFFNDVTTKINHKINDKNHLYISSYLGLDKLSDQSDQTYSANDTTKITRASKNISAWGNFSGAIRWNHLFNASTFSNLTLDYTSYYTDFNEESRIGINNALDTRRSDETSSFIRDMETKFDFESHIYENLSLTYGIQNTFRHISPIHKETNVYQRSPLVNYKLVNIGDEKGIETSIFSDLHWGVNSKLNLNAGARLTRYKLLGNDTDYFLEPRIHATYDINVNTNLSLDYARMNQTVSTLNNTSNSLSSKVLIPATDQLKSSQSDQFSLSYGHIFPKNKAAFKLAIYHKSMRNLMETLSPSSFLILNNDWQREVLSGGHGYSYGAELEISKSFEKISINANYTLSKSMRKFDEINQGEYYPFDFDRRNNLTFTSHFQMSKKFSLSILWIYKTGQPITLSNQFYQASNNYFYKFERFDQSNDQLETPFVTNFEAALAIDTRNNYRMDAYHRMDVSLNYEKQKRKGRIANWNLSVYNAYNRKNPYSIFTKQVGDELKYYQLTLFPIIPSISYGLTF